MVNVYAWPPVGVMARYWTLEQPVGRSRSLITGASYVSGTQRKRILAGLDVHGHRKYGSGYMEALWRHLDGGVHLVRLQSCKIPRGRTAPNSLRGGNFIEWSNPPEPVNWIVPPGEVKWFDGTILQYTLTPVLGQPAVHVVGLPTNAIIALPGEFVTVWIGDREETHMVTAVSRSDEDGEATIQLVTAPTGVGQISIGSRESGVFELVSGWPKAKNIGWRAGDYTGLEFRQVFEDERGPFTEIDPWGPRLPPEPGTPPTPAAPWLDADIWNDSTLWSA